MNKSKKLMSTLFFTITILLASILCVGCSKDVFLDYYKDINEKVGDLVLTNKTNLKGNREFGKDHYTGTYKVTYENFTGKEVIFGGTTIEQDEKNINVKLNIENSSGTIKVIMNLKGNEETLATKDGSYEFDFNIKDGSNYLIIKTDEYSGKVNIEITRRN